jgi:acetyl esterase/lipase
MRLIIIYILLPIYCFCQPPTDRYNVDLFGVSETNEILFSSDVPQPNPGGGFYEWITGLPLNVDESNTDPVNLYMDIFQPTGDTLSQRPLVIIAFGGGFLSGSKDHWSIRLLCQNLAKRGYVTAAIDYRLGMNIFDSDLANRAVYR